MHYTPYTINYMLQTVYCILIFALYIILDMYIKTQNTLYILLLHVMVYMLYVICYVVRIVYHMLYTIVDILLHTVLYIVE